MLAVAVRCWRVSTLWLVCFTRNIWLTLDCDYYHYFHYYNSHYYHHRRHRRPASEQGHVHVRLIRAQPHAGPGGPAREHDGAGKSKFKFKFKILLKKGPILYTVDILVHVECCIRQLWSSSIIACNFTSIAYNHRIHNKPLLNTYTHTHIHIYI